MNAAALAGAAVRGVAAGLGGVAITTAAGKQRHSGRSDAYVPARTHPVLLSLSEPAADSGRGNMVMHSGNGVVLGRGGC